MKKLSLLLLFIFSLLVAAACSDSSSTETEAEGNEDNSEEQTDSGAEENQEAAVGDYPEEPIEVILPFPTGSSYDGAARIFTKHAEKYLPNNQTFALINKTGGGNTAGATELYNAEPDGYKIGFAPTSLLTVDPHKGHVSYSHDSFQPIMKVLQTDGYMFIREDAQWETFDDWVSYLKENPGDFAVAAVPGAVPGLEALQKKAGIEFDIVPFDGFAECITALVGGHVDGTISVIPAMKAQMDAGEVKPFFSTSGKENDLGVPTLQELGIELEENKMVGFIAPKDLPQEKLDLLHEVFKQTMEDPEFQKEFEEAGQNVVYAGPEEFQEDITRTSEFDKEILEIAGMIE